MGAARDINRQVMEFAASGDQKKAIDIFGDRGYALLFKTLEQLTDFNNYQITQKDIAIARLTQIESKSKWLIGIGTTTAIIVTIFFAVAITLSISKPVRLVAERTEQLRNQVITELGSASEAMAQGDLTARSQNKVQLLEIHSKDEIGYLAKAINGIITTAQGTADSFEQALGTLRNVVQETGLLINAAQNGDLRKRGRADSYQGGYQELVAGFNATLDAMVGPIDEAAGVLQKAAERDLTVRMLGEYKGDFAKIKNSLNSAIQTLDQSLYQVATGSEQVSDASGQISSGSQTLSQEASEQASSLEEISSSLQEMSSMTQQNSANAREARALTEGARASTAKGVESMQRLSAAINKIKESSDSTAKIVKTIDEIAFQTNLLALNAAVEAARAGDVGKGFAVVAEEVRNLAMRSAEAAKNTANLIDESVSNAGSGVSINQEVLGNLQEISTQVNKVSEVMAEISSASDQQSQGIDQVNTAVTQMNQVTQNTAANAEESASSSEELASQAAEMTSMVQTFKLSMERNVGRRATAITKPKSSNHQPVVANSSQRMTKSASITNAAKRLIPFDEASDPAFRDF
jgi:methyl-accepting chemotaxis protein